jgi:hypothetical protein
MFARLVLVLTFRMKRMGKRVHASGAGIHAVFHILLSIPQGITLVRFNHKDGDSELCTSFHTCLKGYRFTDVPVAAVVQEHALLI